MTSKITTPLELETQTFKDEVVNGTQPALVDFWAPWWGPCRQVGPGMDRLGDEYVDEIRVGKINIDDPPSLASDYSVRSIPALLFFRDGKVVEKLVGLLPESVIRGKIEELLKPATSV